MKIFITGNLGFIGKETQELLETKGHEVFGFDIMSGFDIRDKDQLNKTVEQFQPDRILHLAAIARFDDCDNNPILALETNVIGTKNVSEIAAKYHVPMVYSSTGSVYMPIIQDPPITEEFRVCGNSVYACTKYLGELYMKDPYIILRYAHIYGKEKRTAGLVGNFINRIQRGLSPILYGGKQGTDFIYVEDIATANLTALTASWEKWNQIYNIGTGEELSAEQAGKIICKLMGWKGKIEVTKQRTVDAQKFVYDCNKAGKMLGFKAKYMFREGIIRMLNKL